MSCKHFLETITPDGLLLILVIEYATSGKFTKKVYHSYLDMPEDERREYLMARVVQSLRNHHNRSENVNLAEREQINKTFERILQNNKMSKQK